MGIIGDAEAPAQTLQDFINDLGQWVEIDDETREYWTNHQERSKGLPTHSVEESARRYPGETFQRRCTKNFFVRTHPLTGERFSREWLWIVILAFDREVVRRQCSSSNKVRFWHHHHHHVGLLCNDKPQCSTNKIPVTNNVNVQIRQKMSIGLLEQHTCYEITIIIKCWFAS